MSRQVDIALWQVYLLLAAIWYAVLSPCIEVVACRSHRLQFGRSEEFAVECVCGHLDTVDIEFGTLHIAA